MSCEASSWLKTFSQTHPVILGSGSVSRLKVMETGGVQIAGIVSPDIDEKAIRARTPQEMSMLIARAKADAVSTKLTYQLAASAIVICSDMVSVFRGVVREKPESPEQAREFVNLYSSGEPVLLVASVVVLNAKTSKRAEGVHECSVVYRHMPQEVVDSIVSRPVVYTCCGGVSIDDKEMGKYVESITGGWDGVMGLPLSLVEDLIKQVI